MRKNFKFRISNFKLNNGFTLVELITVIGILGILSVALITVLNPLEQFKKANDSKRKSDLSQIQKALETYYQDNNRYPATTGNPNYQMQHFVSPFTVFSWGSGWAPYMNVLPEDPKPNYKYTYWVPSDGQTYYIYVSLERGAKDPQVCAGGQCTAPPGSGINMTTACGATCNYGVSTPNVTP